MLHANALAFSRGESLLFENISFELQFGDGLFITGKNGAGKSTLLKIIVGLLHATHGEIYFHDKKIQQDFFSYQEKLHYVAHLNGLKLGLTVKENLCLMAHIQQQNIPSSLEKILTNLQLIEKTNTPIYALSAGQKRRVALAKLFLIPRTIWILDEPLTGLDHATQLYFHQQLNSHLDTGGIAIISTHQSISIASLKNLHLGDA
jgi:heme exporter protein A